MKIEIVSEQEYEDYKDKNIDQYDATINYLEDGVEILYEGCKLRLEGNILFVDGENKKINLAKGEITKSTINTEYGKIDMTFNCIKLEYTKEPFLIYAKYKIALGQTSEYTNEIKITIKQD